MDQSKRSQAQLYSDTKSMIAALIALAGLVQRPPALDWRKVVEATGFEPVTPCLQSRCSRH